MQGDGTNPSFRVGDLSFHFDALSRGHEVAHLAPRPVSLQAHGDAVVHVGLERHVLLELHQRAVAARAPDHAAAAVLDRDGRRSRGRVDPLAFQFAHEQRVGGPEVHDEDLLLRVVDEDAAPRALAGPGERGRGAEGDASEEAVHVAQALVSRRAADGGQGHVYQFLDIHQNGADLLEAEHARGHHVLHKLVRCHGEEAHHRQEVTDFFPEASRGPSCLGPAGKGLPVRAWTRQRANRVRVFQERFMGDVRSD